MVVYLDLIIIFDFIINFIFLCFIEKICSSNINLFRIIVASLTSVLLCIISIFDINFFYVLRIIGGLIISFIGFTSFSKYNKAIKMCLFYVMNFSFVGVLNSFNVKNIYLLIISLIVILVMVLTENLKKYDIFIKRNKYNISVFLDNKEYKLESYLDTGNFSNYNGTPIIFVNKKYKVIMNINTKKMIGISVKTVNDNTIEYGIKPDKVLINQGKNKIIIKDVYILFTNVNIEYDCLLSPLLFL